MSYASLAFKIIKYVIDRRDRRKADRAEVIGDVQDDCLVVETEDGDIFCLGDGLGVVEWNPYYVQRGGHRFYMPIHVYQITKETLEKLNERTK